MLHVIFAKSKSTAETVVRRKY